MSKILWLSSDRGGVGGYRVFTPALSLEDRYGYDNHMVTHTQVVMDPECTTANIDGMDLVVFQRAVGPHFLQWMKYCRDHGVPTVFELDDDLFNVPRRNRAHEYWGRKDVRTTLRTELELCDHVICSTRPLAARVTAEMHWRPGKVSVCANHLHPHVWDGPHLSKRYDNTDTVVIGWQGSSTHEQDFAVATAALVRILADFPQVRLRLFGAAPAQLVQQIDQARVQFVKGVAFERYPSTLAFLNYDIGIAPITDSNFNKSKSNIKYLEYAALSIPCVASRVYPYEKTITHSVNGFLAGTTNEWYEALAALVNDAAYRVMVGTAAHDLAWDHYGPERAEEWHEVFARLISSGGQHGSDDVRVSDAREQPDGEDAGAEPRRVEVYSGCGRALGAVCEPQRGLLRGCDAGDAAHR